MSERATTMLPEWLDPDWVGKLRRNLRRWYARHGRDLPWQGCDDPYLVWISEVMLQQTTVATVVRRFAEFVDRFPTIGSLAEASEEQVLLAWEGLGYYSRARNLHRAAACVVERHEGELPRDAEQLRRLPGIGRYTAAAIASLAFDQPVPIVEANTRRLYCRLTGYTGDLASAVGRRFLWAFADRIVPRRRPGEFNQALMDLGAGVCQVKDPDCNRCPLRSCCRARQLGIVGEVPATVARPPVTELTEVAVSVIDGDRVLLVRIPEGRRWAGLWDFPRFELTSSDLAGDLASGPMCRGVLDWLEERLRDELGIEARVDEHLLRMRHGVTRYRITLDGFMAEYLSGSLPTGSRWQPLDRLDERPLSVSGRRIAGLLVETAIGDVSGSR